MRPINGVSNELNSSDYDEEKSRRDVMTAGRLSYDINYRRFTNADYMVQVYYPYR